MKILFKDNWRIYFLDKYGTLDSKKIGAKFYNNVPHLSNQPITCTYIIEMYGKKETIDVVYQHLNNWVISKKGNSYELRYVPDNREVDYTKSNINKLLNEDFI